MGFRLHRNFILSTSLLLLCFFSQRVIGHQKKNHAHSNKNTILWTDPVKRPYTVLSYDLTLDWRKVFETHSPHYTGTQNILLTLTGDATSITLDAAVMGIDTISVNGSQIFPVPQPSGAEMINIPLPLGSQKAGAQISLGIAYHKDTTGGFYFYPKGSVDFYGDTSLEDAAYTFSEPTDAHYWMPCNDRPDNKALSDISIIVPNGIEAPSNGILVSKKAFTPTSTIWHWKSDQPIVTYLMVADASKFVHWEETHTRSLKGGDTTHLDYYAWQKDYDNTATDGSQFNPRYSLSRTSQIMTWLEGRFGPFPFIKYGQVPVPGFGGGMEHQSLTTIAREWLRGADQVIAHEMGHQWFGDKTTCESFKDIWLNEGFATFCEAIWGEGWGGTIQYMNILRPQATSYLVNQPVPLRPVYDPPNNDAFNGTLTYIKGSCVLHMLRQMVGDSAFFDAMRSYSNNFSYTTATTQQFQDFMSAKLGRDLTEYFDEWIFGAGQPYYQCSWAQGSGNTVTIRVDQLQKERDHFSMPLHFFAYHDGGKIDTLSFNNTARSERFQTVTSYPIDSLGFDDNALILCFATGAKGDSNYYFDPALTTQYKQRVFSHKEIILKNDPSLAVGTSSDIASDFRIERSSDGVVCTFSVQGTNARIEFYNSAGMKILTIPILSGEQIKKIDVRTFPSGIYFVRLGNEVRKMNIIR